MSRQAASMVTSSKSTGILLVETALVCTLAINLLDYCGLENITKCTAK
jgi:hypothetical protein